MNHNDLPSDELLQFVFGELDDARQAEMRKAVAEDAELAAVVQDLTAAVAALRAENASQVGDDFNDRLRRRMPEVFDSTQTETVRPPFLTRSRTTWRWIMRSPVSRVAAAAAVLVLAFTGVALWFHGGGATFAFADFVAPILNAKAVKYKMTVEMKGPPVVTTTSEEMMLDDARMRHETTMPDGSKTVVIQDLSRGKSLTLETASKKATVKTFTNWPKYQTPKDKDPMAGYRLLLRDAQDNPKIKREPLGEKEIDGRRVVGFHISIQGSALDLWGDPKTGLPVRIEMTMGIDGNMKATMSDFAFNVDMDESLFSVDPPAGYTVRQEKTDSSPQEEKDLIEMFREFTKLTRGAFPNALDIQGVSWVFWKTYNIQAMWGNIAMAPMMGETNDEQRRKFEEQVGTIMDEMNDEAMQGKTNKEQTRKFAEQISRVTSKLVADGLWKNVAPASWKDNEQRRREFEMQMRKCTEGTPEQKRQASEEMSKTLTQKLWEDVAPAKWKTDDKRRRQFEKPNKRQKVKEECRKILGDQMLKTVEASEAQLEKTSKDQQARMLKNAEVQKAKSRKFMEAQRQIQRGVMFANQLSSGSDAHYVGKGVKFGAADRPIFWYRPNDAKTYRVIYADLTVHEADTPPNVPNAQPLPGAANPKK